MTNSRLPHNPTEDTPTPPNKDDELDTSNPPAQKLDKSGQDVKQLDGLQHTLKLVPQSQRPLFVDELVIWLVKHDAAAQIQLVSELEGELPKKYEMAFDETEAKGWNKAIDTVAARLAHKKQELERGK